MRKWIELERRRLDGGVDVRGDSFLVEPPAEARQVEALLPVHALDGQELLALDAQRVDRGAQFPRLVRNRVDARESPEKRSRAQQIGSRRQTPEELSRHEFLKYHAARTF